MSDGLVLVPGEEARTEYVNIGNGVKSKVEDVSGEKATKIAKLVSGQMQKRLLEKQLNELMRKRDGSAHTHVTNQVKRRRTLTVATNVDFDIPDFQDFCPFFSMPEKQGVTDWRYKTSRPSSYSSTINSLFRPDSEYLKVIHQTACVASATALLALSACKDKIPTTFSEKLSLLTGTFKKPEDQNSRVRELNSLKAQRLQLYADLRQLLHGDGTEPGLAEKAATSLLQDTIKNTVHRDETLTTLTDILKHRPRLSKAKLVWGIISKPEYTFSLASAKRRADASAFVMQTIPEWVFQDKQIRQSDKARVQCGYDVWPQKCNLEKCTYLHDNGHNTGEASACRKVLHSMGVSKLLDNPALKAQYDMLLGEYNSVFKEVRGDDQNNKKMRDLLTKLVVWGEANKLLGAGSGQPPVKDVDGGQPAAEGNDKTTAMSVLEDLVKLCDKAQLTPLEHECLKATDAPPGLEEAFTVSKLAVFVSRLQKPEMKSLILHNFEPRLTGVLPAFQDFESAIAMHPSCLPIYVLYIEALARNEAGHPKDLVMTSILNVIAKGLSIAPSLGVEASQTTFTLILLGVFFRQCCNDQCVFLEGLMSGHILNMETVLAPKHFAALPVLYTAAKGNVFPECINGLWRLGSGMPLSIDWKGVHVSYDESVGNAFSKFLEKHTYKDLAIKDSLVINYSQYLSAVGKTSEATVFLTKCLKDNPNRLALFKELSDLLDGGVELPVIGFDAFEMYERIIDKEVATRTDPQWHGIATLFYINLLLRHDRVEDAMKVAGANNYEEPFASVMDGITALLQGDETRFRSVLKGLASYTGTAVIQEHILKEILMYKTPTDDDVARFAEISLDRADLTIPGAQFAEWEYLNTCEGLTSNPFGVLKDTRPGRLIAALSSGNASKELLFTDCAFLPSASVSVADRKETHVDFSESDDE
eukprot:TRINITY_DN15219_c0_g1_i1.p1 TRINITY_DN15219_c0_g1~~TRINITY_DN15219_c0_g1_i1.p1  ORF type:complete len:936 (+),score=219.26 TRINITY_DN15219_c0_g1_i1:26-2809(+)